MKVLLVSYHDIDEEINIGVVTTSENVEELIKNWKEEYGEAEGNISIEEYEVDKLTFD